jgi:hypothetical protein
VIAVVLVSGRKSEEPTSGANSSAATNESHGERSNPTISPSRGCPDRRIQGATIDR